MALLKIREYPDRSLRVKCRPVDKIDNGTRALISDMFETMYENRGVGLAANQVGKNIRICVVDIRPGGENKPLVLINPEIVRKSGFETCEEGCLSFPDIVAEVKRSAEITVRALNEDSMPTEFSADGILSRVIQHELDHLAGKVFLDRLPAFRRIKEFFLYRRARSAARRRRQ